MALKPDRSTVFAVSPFAIWMAMMFALPSSSAWAYALRTLASFIALVAAGIYFLRTKRLEPHILTCADKSFAVKLFWGLFIGVIVTFLWIAPEYFLFYRKWCILGDVPSPLQEQTSPYDPNVCGWPLTVLRLIGSAFVIAPAEELFFRAYLYRRLQSEEWRSVDRRRFDWSAFLWTTGLFAVEHNRIIAAVMAGVFYLLVYRRCGLFAATLAHVVTNLLLALFVLYSGAWSFW